ncbi:hypothetical protein DFJ74DRAFT_326912 [Hyaloraphidium curvatum]|nr:hypothetical protein DFJ74DRAFT_326912 [Hyaloraphidium curvatum]
MRSCAPADLLVPSFPSIFRAPPCSFVACARSRTAAATTASRWSRGRPTPWTAPSRCRRSRCARRPRSCRPPPPPWPSTASSGARPGTASRRTAGLASRRPARARPRRRRWPATRPLPRAPRRCSTPPSRPTRRPRCRPSRMRSGSASGPRTPRTRTASRGGAFSSMAWTLPARAGGPTRRTTWTPKRRRPRRPEGIGARRPRRGGARAPAALLKRVVIWGKRLYLELFCVFSTCHHGFWSPRAFVSKKGPFVAHCHRPGGGQRSGPRRRAVGAGAAAGIPAHNHTLTLLHHSLCSGRADTAARPHTRDSGSGRCAGRSRKQEQEGSDVH